MGKGREELHRRPNLVKVVKKNYVMAHVMAHVSVTVRNAFYKNLKCLHCRFAVMHNHDFTFVSISCLSCLLQDLGWVGRKYFLKITQLNIENMRVRQALRVLFGFSGRVSGIDH